MKTAENWPVNKKRFIVRLVDNVIFALLTACIVCVCLAGYFALAAQRASRACLDAQKLAVNVASLEERFDALLRVIRKISAREAMRERRESHDNIIEYRAPQGPPGAAPDWRTNPQEAIAYYTARMRKPVYADPNTPIDAARNRATDHGDPGPDAKPHGLATPGLQTAKAFRRRRKARSEKSPPQH